MGAWVLAARPKTLLAAVAPVVAATGLAVARDVFDPLPALAALVGAVLIQIATNFANDYNDFARGSDTEERVGPTRATQAGLLEPGVVKRGMVVVLGAALLVGAYLVWVGGWPIALVGVLSLVFAVAYTAGPYPLAYHGLGDLFVFLFFGLVAVGGTWWVQALTLPAEVLWLGAALGALNTAILVVNNLRDIHTDAKAGKRTLAVRIGVAWTRREYLLLLFFAWNVPPFGVALFGWSEWCVLALAAYLPAVPTVRRVLRAQEAGELNPALGGTARLAGLYALLFALGVAVW